MAITSVLLVTLTAAVAFDVPGLAGLERDIGAQAVTVSRQSSVLLWFWKSDAIAQHPMTCRAVILVGVIGLLVARRWWHALWLGSVLVISTALAGVVKLVLARPRPSWSNPVATASGYSYPSGHATAAWVLASAAVLLAMSLLPPSWLRVVLMATAITSAVVVSLDRVFLGVHFPSDVVAGALLGCLLTLVPWLGLSGLQDRFETPEGQ